MPAFNQPQNDQNLTATVRHNFTHKACVVETGILFPWHGCLLNWPAIHLNLHLSNATVSFTSAWNETTRVKPVTAAPADVLAVTCNVTNAKRVSTAAINYRSGEVFIATLIRSWRKHKTSPTESAHWKTDPIQYAFKWSSPVKKLSHTQNESFVTFLLHPPST